MAGASESSGGIDNSAIKSVFQNYRCPHCGESSGFDSLLKVYRDESIFQGLTVKCPKCGKTFHYQIYT